MQKKIIYDQPMHRVRTYMVTNEDNSITEYCTKCRTDIDEKCIHFIECEEQDGYRYLFPDEHDVVILSARAQRT